MAENIQQEGLEHLENIEHELKEIKERTGVGRWVSLRNGIYQGVGAVIGSIIAVLVLSFILAHLGVIPGFGDIGAKIQDAYSQARGR